MDINQLIARELQLPLWKVEAAVKLLKDGNTVPFIARYRKEMTGEMDEVQIRKAEELLKYHENLAQRKADVIRLIGELGLMTTELEAEIMKAVRPAEVEDLYRPFRPKRKTRASMAREKGLEGLANFLLTFPLEAEPETEALKYVSEKVKDAAEALQGAQDILAEYFSDIPEVWRWVRDYMMKNGLIISKAASDKADPVYKMYFDYSERVRTIRPHRILAINRGEKQGHLKAGIDLDSEAVMKWMSGRFLKEGTTARLVQAAYEDAYKRLIAPSVERDIRNDLTTTAERHSISIYGKNLRQLLLQRPVNGKVMLGLDPAYRTGVKFAVIDQTGKLMKVGVVYPTPPRKDTVNAAKALGNMIEAYGVNLIVIGNGTASRETEEFTADLIQSYPGVSYTIANEAGASVYSASELAAGEFPELDVAERSAVSIARRIQDPLAELVKIDPRSMGVGQYQHDMPVKALDEALTGVVESAVNYAGVDLNTASQALLRYIAGLNAATAGNIVKYREENGAFKNRKQLLKVSKLGPKAYQQAAGFLRIAAGDNPLDNTPIHPESYELARALFKLIDAGDGELGQESMKSKLAGLKPGELAARLDAGAPTIKDIIDALMRPGRDPREELPAPVFRQNVLKIEELSTGMEVQGEVRNIVDFGAFIDIGLKNDALMHVSQIADRRIEHPIEVLSVGDIIRARVVDIDLARQRVGISMKGL